MKYGIFGGLFTVAVACLLTAPAWAGGLYNYEIGSDDTGLASAGYASRAQDAATLYTNPAGMTRLEQSELMVAFDLFYYSLKFDPNSNTSPENLNQPGGAAAAHGNASSLIPGPGLFYVNKISDKFAAGFGVFGFFGGPLEYENNWVGRYHTVWSNLGGITFMPSVSYKASDKISVGAALNAMYTTYDAKVAINNRRLADPTAPDGSMELKDNIWAFGGKFGVLYEPTKETRVGLTYLTKTKLDLSATPVLTSVSRPGLADILGRLNLDLTMRIPEQFILSVYHDLTDKLAVMGDFGWEDWQTFGKVNVAVNNDPPGGITANSHYKNTWHVALGTQYKLSDPWKISLGGAYDSSLMDGVNRTPSYPGGQAWRIGTGAQYVWSKTMILSGSYEYVWTGNMSMDVSGGPLTGRVAGEYNNSYLQVLTLVLRWKL